MESCLEMEDHTIFTACGPHRIEISSCRISNMHNYFQVYCSGMNLSALIETFLVNGALTILPMDMLRTG